MLDDPPQSMAAVPLAFVFIPQPRFTVGVPVKLIPVSALLSMLIMQYLPVCTTAAVAEALIVGVELVKKLEKAKVRCAETVTRTALVSADQVPAVGGACTVHVGVVPRRFVTSPRVKSREIGLLALQLPLVTVCVAILPNAPASAPLSAAR
jgi:hypothetical protein